MTLREILSEKLLAALERSFPGTSIGTEAPVVPATDLRFGDYQSNIAMGLAGKLRMPPRKIAEEIRQALEVEDWCSETGVAGAGFLNFRLRPEAVARRALEVLSDPAVGVYRTERPETILIDFSSPNVAKPMHVGHIRSTILGDALARIARFLGHSVVTDNHVGDWGTQFGKIIYGWKHLLQEEQLRDAPVPELLRLYREVNALEKEDPDIAVGVRQELVKLQQGDAENLAIWQKTVELSWVEFDRLYGLLDVSFDEKLGESFYNDRLGPLVDRLLESGIARVSEGAVCIFFPEDSPLADKPCLIRKSDGGFLYATTDLATIEYRRERWNPDQVWYVTGAPQALHFQQLFAAAKMMEIPSRLVHIAFGSILGEDRKIMKTRSGENVQLGEVLEEAVRRALDLVRAKNPSLPENEVSDIARDLGIGAVKYAELSQHRMTDYVFSWDKMLAFQGNTAPYLQNAYVRIRSIFRKLGDAPPPGPPASLLLEVEEERLLALKVCQFGETLPEVLQEFRPNLLANYLYELANTFHSFYEKCPVLKSEGEVRASRLALCDLTSLVLSTGLGLLGIRCPEKM